VPATPRARRLLVWAACVAAVLLPAGSALLGGTDALLGSLVGLGLVAAFFVGGRLPVRVADRVPKGVAFMVLGVNYVARILLLLIALLALGDATWLDPRFVGGTVIAGALVWSVAQIGEHMTSRRPTIEPAGR
jgi:hypothetical protein